jgi:hypothetical protein
LADNTIEFYKQFQVRVDNLNRSQQNYRIFFATIVGAFFAGLKFFGGTLDLSVAGESIDAIAVIIFIFSSVTLIAMCIIAFLDFILQELIEESLRGAEKIELQSTELTEKNIYVLGHRRKHVSSTRMAITISLYYFLPIFCVFSLSMYLTEIIVFMDESFVNSYLASIACSKRMPNFFPEIDQYTAVPDTRLFCISKPYYFSFSDEILKFIVPVFVFQCGIFFYFITYSLRRIVPRAMREVINLWMVGPLIGKVVVFVQHLKYYSICFISESRLVKKLKVAPRGEESKWQWISKIMSDPEKSDLAVTSLAKTIDGILRLGMWILVLLLWIVLAKTLVNFESTIYWGQSLSRPLQWVISFLSSQSIL